MKQAADILDGTHNAWKTLLRRANEVWGPGPPSALNESHLDDLRKFGAAESIPRNSPALVSRLFLTPKSDGLTSRPILDARVQNEMVDWNEVHRGKFRLLQPLGHIRVGVGLGVEGEMELFEADAVSYFPAFRWSEALGRAHAFRVGGRRFAHVVPAQGSCLMPLVAQTVSAYLAESPVVDAPSGAFIRSRVSIVYDNFLFSDEPQRLRARAETFMARATKHGVVLKPQYATGGSLESCGFKFYPKERCWTLKDAWVEKATRMWRTAMVNWEVKLGLAVWAARALLLPLAILAPMVTGEDGVDATRCVEAMAKAVESVPRRMLKQMGKEALDCRDAIPVAVDASIYGAGWIIGEEAYSMAWRWQRDPREQQQAEWQVAIHAIKDGQHGSGLRHTIWLSGNEMEVHGPMYTGVGRRDTGYMGCVCAISGNASGRALPGGANGGHVRTKEHDVLETDDEEVWEGRMGSGLEYRALQERARSSVD